MSSDFCILFDRVRDGFQHMQNESGTKCSILTALVQPAPPELIEKCQVVVSGAKSLLVMSTNSVPTTIAMKRTKLDSIFACMNTDSSFSSHVQSEQKLLKFIIPNEAGYMIRNDIFEERLRGCSGIHKVVGLVKPMEFVHWPQFPQQGLSQLLRAAVCCILIDDDGDSYAQLENTIESQLIQQLSLQWTSPKSINMRRLAVVGEVRQINASWRFFKAAHALGVKVVAIGPRGHWLGKGGAVKLAPREAFIEIDMTVDHGLSRRISNAIQGYNLPIHGLTTVTEFLLIPVAQAAERLGLPTSPSESFAKSVNKHHMRSELSPDSCRLVSSLDGLVSQITSNERNALPPGPPWIVKPCFGWHSLGVHKVTTLEGLIKAVGKVSRQTAFSRTGEISKDSGWQTDVLIEEYCDGPEVDCNFVLLRGEIIFFEVIDNFPCTAESSEGNADSDNFKETRNVFPSTLPPSEVATLQEALHQAILRLGFRSGVFHVEARVRNSSHQYQPGVDGEPLDLRPNPIHLAHDASVFLIEINARPPGYVDTCATAYTNGVDLFALHILIALRDEYRLRALSQPHQARRHVAISAIQAEKSGVVASDDPWKDLEERSPTIMSRVMDPIMNFGKGDIIEDPQLSTTPWLAAFTVYSLTSRAETLSICDQIKDDFECKID
ncbi:unnamed protein product [Penicillium nalgiovense]|uniref:ATP-grasp domain-containing protein n=1 Tax=Penicillium nalgiovense TaxID=60175 RepID=A0A9W4MQL5_PENNA|nr:unnamed protein product [Penicillium nalgiovense]CAG7955075.1 unnamed protein product [Penicillium nalgiovense]CAG7958080.1 unnamed protein product [Penicillium nalgiovense]CAG7958761.1 unnamed protein product [Penicillium nalgiovense]CAG7976553.1 unnamed protein product [Penicillium nalgiovense]